MGLEDLLYGSKTIRDYLKLFSEQNWNRVSKATILIGIQYLKHISNNDLRQLSPKQIEDIVVRNQEQGLQIPQKDSETNNQREVKSDKKKRKKKDKKRNQNDKKVNESSFHEISEYAPESSHASSVPEIEKTRQPQIIDQKNKSRNQEIPVATKSNGIATKPPLKTFEKIEQIPSKDRPQTATIEQTQMVAPKAPSSWRRGASQKPERVNKFQQDQQNQKQARSASLNPLIYPSWWGQDEDIELQDDQVKSISADRKKEDSLDKRLREAEKKRREQQFEKQQQPQPPTQTYYHQQLLASAANFQSNPKSDQSPSYGYTSNKYAQKYSPLRQPVPGSNNTPMSYAGPPSQQEIDRNKNRLHHNNAYDQPRPINQKEQKEQKSERQREPPSAELVGKHREHKQHREGGRRAEKQNKGENNGGGGFSRGGGLVLSYSPPKGQKYGPSSKSDTQQNYSNGQSKNHTQGSSKRPKQIQTTYIPPNSNRDKQNVPKHLQNVQSKVKDQIEYHKRKFREQQQNTGNSGQQIQKETQVLHKNPPENYSAPTTNKSSANPTGAALRRRPSPTKENNVPQGDRHQYQHQHQYQYAQEEQQESLRGTQGQWPSSIENLNNSQQRSTNQGFYNQRTRQGQLEPTVSGGGPGTVGEITQGLINSPIMSQFSESSPEGKSNFGRPPSDPSYHHHPAQQHAQQQQQYRGGQRQTQTHTQFNHPSQANNDSNDQVIMFRSDGFDQSRFYQQTNTHNQNNFSRYSRHPNQGAQPQVTSSGEINTSSFHQPSYVHTLDQTRPSNPFSKNQNMSGYTQSRQTDENFRGGHRSGMSSREGQDGPWVGEYVMNENQKRQYDQKTLHDLAQSNSYTYTLQKPIQQPNYKGAPVQQQSNRSGQSFNQNQQDRGRMQTFQPDNDSQPHQRSEHESEGSDDLSNYSPNDDIRGFLQHQQYQQQDPNQTGDEQQQLIYAKYAQQPPSSQYQPQPRGGPYNYPVSQQQNQSYRQGPPSGIDPRRQQHQDLQINENESDSEFSSGSEYSDEEEEGGEGGLSSSGGGSSQSSTSSYQQEAPSAYYRQGGVPPTGPAYQKATY